MWERASWPELLEPRERRVIVIFKGDVWRSCKTGVESGKVRLQIKQGVKVKKEKGSV